MVSKKVLSKHNLPWPFTASVINCACFEQALRNNRAFMFTYKFIILKSINIATLMLEGQDFVPEVRVRT